MKRLRRVKRNQDDVPPATPTRESHLRWVLDTLMLALRLLGITNREVETRLGWSHGYLSRIFAGTIELRFEHILSFLEVLEIHPAEFFDLAWPNQPEPPSPAAASLRSLLRRYQPGHPLAGESVPKGAKA